MYIIIYKRKTFSACMYNICMYVFREVTIYYIVTSHERRVLKLCTTTEFGDLLLDYENRISKFHIQKVVDTRILIITFIFISYLG